MRILFVLPEYLPQNGGGIVTWYRNLLPKLAAMGHHVHVISGSPMSMRPKEPSSMIDGVVVEVLDSALQRRYLEKFSRYRGMPGLQQHLAAAWAMKEQVRDGVGFDLVEAADWGLGFVPWALGSGPAIIARMHGSIGQIDIHDGVKGEEALGNLARMIEVTCLKLVNGIFTYSLSNANYWRREVDRQVEFDLPVWRPEGVDVSGARTARGIVVGRMQKWKGPQTLGRALRRLGPDAPQIDWYGRDTVLGCRTHTMAAQMAAEFPEIWSRSLHHQQQVSSKRIAELLGRAAFAIVPSSWDVFNFTCIEAMAMATPVICSTGAGAAQHIQDGVNGFLFEAEDDAALATALSRLQKLSPAERETMGEAARRDVQRAFDLETNVTTYLTTLRGVVEGRRSPVVVSQATRLLCAPLDGDPSGFEFLDQLPLRALVKYVARRALAKLR